MNQFIPNSFQVANAMVDDLIATLSGNALKCYLIIIRKTRGWHKEADAISLSQFEQLANIDRKTVSKALAELENLKLIVSKKEVRKTTLYRLANESEMGVEVGEKFPQSRGKIPLVARGKIPPTKDNIKNNKKQTPPLPPQRGNGSADAELVVADAPTARGGGGRSKSASKKNVPCRELLAIYNQVLGDYLPMAQALNDKRKRELQNRWGEVLGTKNMAGNVRYDNVADGLVWWTAFFEKVKTNSHWLGDNARGWRADFDWVLKSANFVKILEFVPLEGRNG